jgi:hypothetical protein
MPFSGRRKIKKTFMKYLSQLAFPIFLMFFINCSIIRIEKNAEVIKEIQLTCKSQSWGTEKDSELEGIWAADSSKCPPDVSEYDDFLRDNLSKLFSEDCHWGNYNMDFTWHDVKISGTANWLNNDKTKWEGSGDWYTDKKSLYLCIDWIKTYYHQKSDLSIDTVYKIDTIFRQMSKFEYRVFYNQANLTLTAQGKDVYLHNVNSKYYKQN